jgi:hypothetical protein
MPELRREANLAVHRPSVCSGNLIAGDRTKNRVSRSKQRTAAKPKELEAALVDVHRESDRDVLRNPAGLNDTLLGLISTVSLSDSAPTNQAAAVSREIMARVDAEIGKLERLAATEVATVNRLALGQEVEAASA